MNVQSLDPSGAVANSPPDRADGVQRSSAAGDAQATQSVKEAGKAADAAAVDATTLQRAVEQTNKMIQPVAADLQFSIDSDTKAIVVKVVDTSTNTVIRQVPSAEMLEISKALDKLQGLLVKSTA